MRQPSWKIYRKIYLCNMHDGKVAGLGEILIQQCSVSYCCHGSRTGVTQIYTLYVWVKIDSCEFCRKIQMMEDSDGIIHLKNLSLHPAANEEEGEREESVVYLFANQILFITSFELAISWRHKQNDCRGT